VQRIGKFEQCHGGTIFLDEGSFPLATAGSPAAVDIPALAQALFKHVRRDPRLKLIPAVERELIIHALFEVKGNQVQAPKLLGITRATLRKPIEKFKIRQKMAIQ
jgi:two-component system nitrogen regulation response regulator GlnG